MSQHDMNVANDTGAAVRADINNALAALVGLSSGTSAPSTTFAYMLWADTTNALWKMRNGANTAWITIGPLADIWSAPGAIGSTTKNNAGFTYVVVSNGSGAQIALSVEGYPAGLPTMKLNRDNTDAQAALWIRHERADGASVATAITFENQLNNIVGNLTMGAGNAVALTSTSDGRLKRRIGPASPLEAADRLARYDICEWEWRDIPGVVYVSGIAQQIHDVNPAVAHEGGDDPKTEPWTIDKAEYAHDLILGWKHHHSELEQLRDFKARATKAFAALGVEL